MAKFIILVTITTVLGFIAVLFYVKSVFQNNRVFSKSSTPRYANLHERKRECHKSCLTKDCVITANRIQELMDTGADPCVDFYQYVCGNYIKQNYPEDGKSASMLMKLSDEVQNTVSFMLRSLPDEPFKRIKTYHSHCVDFVSSEVSYFTGVRKLLSKVGLEGWPNLSPDWTTTHKSPDEILSRVLVLGQYSFVKIGSFRKRSHRNASDVNSFDVSLDFDPLILSPLLYIHQSEHEDNEMKTYRYFFHYVLQMFDFKGDVTQLVNETLSFETSLAVILQQHKLIDEDSWISREKVPHDPYQADDSKWANVLKLYFQTSGFNINTNRIRLVRTNRQLIEGVRHQLDSTPFRVIANYIALRLIRDNIEYANYNIKESAINSKILFDNLNIEINNKKSREHFCNDLIIRDLLLEISSAYAEKYLHQPIINRLIDIYSALENKTIDFILETSMYDDFVKDSLIEYLFRLTTPKTFFFNLCRKEQLLGLTKYFQINYVAEEFIINTVERKTWITKMKILMPLGNLTFEPCQMANPNFDAEVVGNIISVGSGVLRLPMLSIKRPIAIDIATLGSVLAHEMGHIIEHAMQKEEKTEEIQRNVEENNKCFIDQYSKIKWHFIKEKFKGNFTLDENVADNFARHVTYQMFDKDWEQQRTQLPGFLKSEMNTSQIYFLLSSQTFCEVVTSDGEKVFHEHDRHSPGEFRVLETLKNFASFSKSFGCPLGSSMNPLEKCVYRRLS